jgi:hypothetical protein
MERKPTKQAIFSPSISPVLWGFFLAASRDHEEDKHMCRLKFRCPNYPTQASQSSGFFIMCYP